MIFGISVVRNEADVIAICLHHHLFNEGFDRILIADNGSTDGTKEAILSLDNPNVTLSFAPGDYRQADIVTSLARQACSLGATWIVPFDADEFWHANGGISCVLNRMNSNSCLEVEVVNYIQSHSVDVPARRSLLNVCYRPEHPFGLYKDAQDDVISDRCSFVEMPYPPKYIAWSTEDIEISPGNHSPQPRTNIISVPEIKCLHVPLRSKNVLNNKVDHSKRLDKAGYPNSHGWHIRRFSKICEQEGLDVEWKANSCHNGILHARRGPVSLTYDAVIPTLLKPIVNPGLLNRARSKVRRFMSKRS